jgi:hypothetical protein
LDLAVGDLAGVPGDDPRVLEEYVRELLEGAEGELAARLVEIPEP